MHTASGVAVLCLIDQSQSLVDDVEVVVHRDICVDFDPRERRGALQCVHELRLDSPPVEQEPFVVCPRHEVVVGGAYRLALYASCPCHNSIPFRSAGTLPAKASIG